MKFKLPTIALVVLIFVTAACGGGTKKPPVVTSPTKNPAIGNISRIRSSVQAGHSGYVTEVEGTRDFFNNDSITVHNNGKGRVNFIDGMELTLYNDTTTEGIVAQVSPPAASLLLTNQGFQGYVPKGNKLTVNLPNGASVRILGTHFFVLFDPDSNIAVAGNFDGTVQFTPPNGGQQDLPPATMVDIKPDSNVDFLDLNYDPGTFDSVADGAGTPFDGIRILRQKFNQPMPNETTAATGSPAKPITTVLRHLVTRSGDSYTPDLADQWLTDPDGYIIDFYLHPGVYLPDGTPFTSTVVRDLLESQWQYAIDGKVSFEIIDDYTIRFQLFEPAVGYVLDQMSMFEFEVQLG